MYSAQRGAIARTTVLTRTAVSTQCLSFTTVGPSIASNMIAVAFVNSSVRSTTLLRNVGAAQSVRFFTSVRAVRNPQSKNEPPEGPPRTSQTVERELSELEQGIPVAEFLARDKKIVGSRPLLKGEDAQVHDAVAQDQGIPNEIPVDEGHEGGKSERIEELPTQEAKGRCTPVGEILERDSDALRTAPDFVNEVVNEGVAEAHLSSPESNVGTSGKDRLENAKSSDSASRATYPVLAGLASHLINLRLSGLRLDEYIERTGANELGLIRDDIFMKKQALAETEAEAAKRKSPNEPYPHDPHWQAVQARKAKEFVLPGAEDPIVSHLVNLIMRDGKKQRAQRIVAEAFVIVRLRMQDDPVKVLRYVVEQTMPLVKIKKVKSGAKSFSVPKALTARQRHRKALDWILEEAEKRPSPSFGVRLGDALVAVRQAVDTGAALEKKNVIHKVAIENRAYINAKF
ncbi:ribosomal protein S7 domain-containing protein [Lipomyces orientalis]|uniref:Ribosomal protein S7 domain-containing protein n=1 Tax=Lipomyces orientalis TaxID=1233043 RepID=A0ACC3TV70_9ASCO